MSQWWPVSYKLHYAAFGGSHERDHAIAMHQKSMDRVRDMVPKENLLEWKVQDGWGPLCEFLGEKQPEGRFPKVNEGAEFGMLAKGIRWGLLRKAANRVGLWVSTLGVVGVGIWWLRKE